MYEDMKDLPLIESEEQPAPVNPEELIVPFELEVVDASSQGQGVRGRSKKTRPKPSCKMKAVELLARSDQSIKRLSDKLKHKEYSSEEIAETVEWLQEKRYIQEEEGCQRRFTYMYEHTVYSLRQIVVKLQQQGYDRDLIQSFIPDDTDEREYQAALTVGRRKYKPQMEPAKFLQHLAMKGFSYDTARNVLDDIQLEWEENM